MIEFEIAGRKIGPQRPCLIVGEVAQAHDGSLGTAHAFIDAIADAGADAVKFQAHIAAAESTSEESFRVQFSKQDANRYEYWKRMEFTEEQWSGLADHARDQRLIFLSSPFSIEAVDLLSRVGMPAWKVASGEVTNIPMFDRISKTGLPILLSTGMSPLSEVDAAVDRIKQRGLDYLIFQSTSAYPCPAEKVGLNLIQFFRQRYECPVGLSDHSGTVYAGLAAVTLGIEMLEVHIVMSREMFGPDVPASITTAELKQLVEGARFIEEMNANPVEKDVIAQDMDSVRRLFTRSVVARTELSAGTSVRREHLTVKKPATGIPAARFEELIGRTLRRNVAADQILQDEDFETQASSSPED